ncbi:MAG TPA: DUF6600 domain-containing protein [Dongiaceae bacterium]
MSVSIGYKTARLVAAISLMIAPLCALSGSASAQSDQDPPDDVARLAEISGTVSYHEPNSQDWQAATANYPLAPGAGVWTEPRSHAAVDLGGARIHIDGSSELEISAIGPQAVQVSVPQGAAFLHVYPGVTGQTFEIDTPHGAARISQPGQYEVVAGDDQHPMTVSVLEGAAQVAGQTANLTLQAGQRGSINPDNTSGTDAAQSDDFIRTVQADEQPYTQPQAVAQTEQYVAPSVPGYQDLARYGQWQQNPTYGAVWTPQQVAADWAPYRDGHWAYVAPWGWTWVDDAPWGFTPFHYGRWVQVGNRWGWTPGQRVERPVYAPALVTFFGDVGAAAVSLSVGWVPLAPEEVYVPPYRHSDRYIQAINITNVRDRTKIVNITKNTTIINYNDYRNHGGATMVSRDVLVNSRPVGHAFGKPSNAQSQQEWAHAKSINDAQIGSRPNNFGRPANGPKITVVQNGKMAGRTVYQYPNGETRTQPKSETQKPQSQSQWNKNAAAKPPLPKYQNGKPQGSFSQTNNASSKGNQPKWKAQPPKPAYVPNTNKNNSGQPVIPPVNGTKAKPDATHQVQVNGKPSFNPNAQGNGQAGAPKPTNQKPNVIYPPVQGKSNTQQKPAAHTTTPNNPKFTKTTPSDAQFKSQAYQQNNQKQSQRPQFTNKQTGAKPIVVQPNTAKNQPVKTQAPKVQQQPKPQQQPKAQAKPQINQPSGQPCGGKQTACGSQVK